MWHFVLQFLLIKKIVLGEVQNRYQIRILRITDPDPSPGGHFIKDPPVSNAGNLQSIFSGSARWIHYYLASPDHPDPYR
jgi:hypothetical protein